jgi:hypothetical protein
VFTEPVLPGWNSPPGDAAGRIRLSSQSNWEGTDTPNQEVAAVNVHVGFSCCIFSMLSDLRERGCIDNLEMGNFSNSVEIYCTQSLDHASISRSRTFTACSAGLLPPPSSHALSFGIGTSCTVDGDSTATLNRVAGPGAASIMAHFRNSAKPSAAAS